jgi:hypothetical protein
VAPNARGSAGIGWLLFFPNMFLAGVYFPTEDMSATIYPLLVVPLVPYVLSQNPSAGGFAITVGIAVAAGAWIAWFVHLHPAWTGRPWLTRVYFIGLVTFIVVLTVRSPWSRSSAGSASWKRSGS